MRRSTLPKSFDPKKPRSSRQPGSEHSPPSGKRTSKKPRSGDQADSAPAPTLTWAKWIESLGSDREATEGAQTEEATAEQLLRMATMAARRARAEREQSARVAPAKSAPAKPRAKVAAKPKAKVAARPKAKVAAKPKAKVAARPKAKVAARPEARPGGGPRARPTAKPTAIRPAAAGPSPVAKPTTAIPPAPAARRAPTPPSPEAPIPQAAQPSARADGTSSPPAAVADRPASRVPPRHDPDGLDHRHLLVTPPAAGPATPPAPHAETLRPPAPPAITGDPAAPRTRAPQQPGPYHLADEPLPHAFGDDRITLLCKDPHWLHAYWEITPRNYERGRRELASSEAFLALRVFHFATHDAQSPEGSFDIDVSEGTRNWYVNGGRPGASFEVEIGLRSPDGRFVPLARSNRAYAPTDRMSDVLDEEWLSLAEEYEQMYALSGGYRALSGGSIELRELLARRLEEMMGSGAVSSFGVSSFGASGAYPAREQARGFWFVLGTELIVYGATEPDAAVTCQGQPVTLRPDGTFTLRFALPDGTQLIPCAATSADKVDTITITPRVEKSTSHKEQRGGGGGGESASGGSASAGS
jgi:hypothetical protein